jgi:transcriptional regulator with XRE-family HTH domain
VPTASADAGVGALLRDWRERRARSQLDLALEAGISAKHLSFVETGRSTPSPRMIVKLASELDVPHRDRNRLLLAAGYAPLYAERSLEAEEMAPVREAIEQVLSAHEPYPAVVVDGHWNLLASNDAVGALLEGVSPALLEPPANVLRISLHPDGTAPRIVNLGAAICCNAYAARSR